MPETLASCEVSPPAVWTLMLEAALLGVALGIRVVKCLILELDDLAFVLEALALLLGFGEGFGVGEGEALALGVGEGDGELESLVSPPAKLHEPWRTPSDSEPKNLNNPSEKSRLPGPHPIHCRCRWCQIQISDVGGRGTDFINDHSLARLVTHCDGYHIETMRASVKILESISQTRTPGLHQGLLGN
jgi:hypothetical protein